MEGRLGIPSVHVVGVFAPCRARRRRLRRRDRQAFEQSPRPHNSRRRSPVAPGRAARRSDCHRHRGRRDEAPDYSLEDEDDGSAATVEQAEDVRSFAQIRLATN